MFDFSTVETLTIPEGFVDKITRDDGTLVWEREIEGLPVSYQRVEYIQADGSQGIIYPDYFADVTEIILTFAPTEFYGSFVGGSYAYTTNTTMSYATLRISKSAKRLESYANQSQLTTPAMTLNTIYTMSTKVDNQTLNHDILFKQGETILSSQNIGFSKISGSVNSLKFGIGCNGYLVTSGGSSGSFKKAECLRGKVYSYQHKRNEVLVHDFVPCYRKSDNVIGMYDIIAKKFYTNAGIGSFTKGADV